jgi:hypothetical protein
MGRDYPVPLMPAEPYPGYRFRGYHAAEGEDMTETDEAFLKRMASVYEKSPTARVPWIDFHRLMSLARRGAAVPDEAT